MPKRSTVRRISIRLPRALSKFVARTVGAPGLYATPSEYVSDLIRQDMEQREGQLVRTSILMGYRDLANRRRFASSGDFKADMELFEAKERQG